MISSDVDEPNESAFLAFGDFERSSDVSLNKLRVVLSMIDFDPFLSVHRDFEKPRLRVDIVGETLALRAN
jgi:hypothetical protein